MDCIHCTSWLLPHQYTTVEDLQDQLSDILEILGSSYACLTARTSTDMLSRLPELKEQVLSRMSDHSHRITISSRMSTKAHSAAQRNVRALLRTDQRFKHALLAKRDAIIGVQAEFMII